MHLHFPFPIRYNLPYELKSTSFLTGIPPAERLLGPGRKSNTQSNLSGPFNSPFGDGCADRYPCSNPHRYSPACHPDASAGPQRFAVAFPFAYHGGIPLRFAFRLANRAAAADAGE